VYEFLRNDAPNAKNSTPPGKSELRRNTFGAAAGGRIKKDKTFFFGSWESMRLRQGFTQTLPCRPPPSASGNFSSLLNRTFRIRSRCSSTTGLPARRSPATSFRSPGSTAIAEFHQPVSSRCPVSPAAGSSDQQLPGNMRVAGTEIVIQPGQILILAVCCARSDW